MHFIELHIVNNERGIFINTDFIKSVKPNAVGRAFITMTDSYEIVVVEQYDEVVQLIRNAYK